MKAERTQSTQYRTADAGLRRRVLILICADYQDTERVTLCVRLYVPGRRESTQQLQWLHNAGTLEETGVTVANNACTALLISRFNSSSIGPLTSAVCREHWHGVWFVLICMVKVSDGQLAHLSNIVYSGDTPSGRTSGFYEFDEHSNEETGLGVRVYTTFDTRKENDGPGEAAAVFAWRGTDTSCGFQMAKAQLK